MIPAGHNMDETWGEYQLLVLNELKKIGELQREVHQLRVELAVLRTQVQFRSGVWGAVAGALTAIGLALLKLYG